MALAPTAFREVMGCLAGGVTIVTSITADGRPHGLTATAVCSVSLDPPLVLVCVDRNSQTLEVVRASRRYALNLLRSTHRSTSDRFAGSDGLKFEALEWKPAPGGSPLLPGALAWVECEVESSVEAGDHTVFIGRVTAGQIGDGGDPLVHFRGRYHTVSGLGE